MEILATIIISFVVISLMMLATGVGLVFGRKQAGKTCGTLVNRSTGEACCQGESQCGRGPDGDLYE